MIAKYGGYELSQTVLTKGPVPALLSSMLGDATTDFATGKILYDAAAFLGSAV